MNRKDLLTSVVCTVLFAVVIVACGGGGEHGINILPSPSGSAIRLSLFGGNKTSAHVGTGSPLMTAGFFQTQSANLAQSFNAICDLYNPGVVPAGAFVAVPGSGNACNTWTTIPTSGDGKIIHDPGALSTLVVDVGIGSTDTVSCVNKTSSAAVSDQQKVRAFFKPDVGQVVIVANNAVTALSCSAPIPPGAAIRSIEAQWVKQ
jgi:hypothetical protein